MASTSAAFFVNSHSGSVTTGGCRRRQGARLLRTSHTLSYTDSEHELQDLEVASVSRVTDRRANRSQLGGAMGGAMGEAMGGVGPNRGVATTSRRRVGCGDLPPERRGSAGKAVVRSRWFGADTACSEVTVGVYHACSNSTQPSLSPIFSVSVINF